MRARIIEEFAPFAAAFRRFKPSRWYAAEWVDHGTEEIRLIAGRSSSTWPRHQVEVRRADDDEWEIRSAERRTEQREGQSLDYPARRAECPEGHLRTIPTRFDTAVVELRCAECGRAYRLSSR